LGLYSAEGIRSLVRDLTLLYGYGIGYAFSFEEVMNMPLDWAEYLWEEKREAVETFAKED